MEKVVGARTCSQQHISYEYSKFSENSNRPKNLLFHSKGLKLDHCGIFDALYPFLEFFKL